MREYGKYFNAGSPPEMLRLPQNSIALPNNIIELLQPRLLLIVDKVPVIFSGINKKGFLMIGVNKILGAFILLFLITNVKGNDNYKLRYTRIDFSYCFGGQVYNDNFNYNPGITIQGVYGYKLNSYVGIGAGIGYQQLTHENFLPVFFEVWGIRKDKKNPPSVRIQIGYAPGWYNQSVDLEGYSYRGGAFFDVGFGRNFLITEKWSVLFHLSYRHQFAAMKYEVYSTKEYKDVLNYDMLIFSLGIINKQTKPEAK